MEAAAPHRRPGAPTAIPTEPAELVSVMKDWLGDAGFQAEGCWSIGCLATENRHRVRLGRGGGINVVVAAMHRHPLEAVVQRHGCRALLFLARLDTVNTRTIGKIDGGIEAIMTALQNHPGDITLQKNGAAALRALRLDDANAGRITDLMLEDNARLRKRNAELESGAASKRHRE